MPLIDRFGGELAALGLAPGRALVAVSGGLDSIALLHLLQRLAGAHRLELVVAHADHGIQPSSERVAADVASFAGSLGLRCEIARLELGAGTGETAAREARYAWLFDLRARLDATVIFTAHHADDQAETVLMRALEGSGRAGLAGMSAASGCLVRPLLVFRRVELGAYAREHRLPVWVDPANSDPNHLRSWLRADLLPAIRRRLPEVDAKLLRLAAHSRRERLAWEQALDLLPGLDFRPEDPGISVAGPALAAYDSALAQTVLIAAARRAGIPLGVARAARALSLLPKAASGTEVSLGAGWRAEVAFGRLRIVPVAAGPAAVALALEGRSGEERWGDWRITWRPEASPGAQKRVGRTAWFEVGALVVRPWVPGDRVRPLAGTGSRLVVRCFQDARVPRRRRESWPVFTAPDRVVWIPGVCRSDALLPPAGAEALRIDVEHA